MVTTQRYSITMNSQSNISALSSDNIMDQVIFSVRKYASKVYGMRKTFVEWKDEDCLQAYRWVSLRTQELLLNLKSYEDCVPVAIKDMTKCEAMKYTTSCVKDVNAIMALANKLPKQNKITIITYIGTVQSTLSVLKTAINEYYPNTIKTLTIPKCELQPMERVVGELDARYAYELYKQHQKLVEVEAKLSKPTWATQMSMKDEVFEVEGSFQADSKESSVLSSTGDLLESGATAIGSTLGGPVGGLIGGGLGKLARNLFGLNENDSDSPAVVPADAGMAMAITDVPRQVRSFAYKMDSEMETSHDLFCESRINDLLERCQQWSLLWQAVWQTVYPSGTLLKTVVISPTCVITGVNQGPYANTALSYIGPYYTYWRGDLEYMIEVVGTQFHQGQLFIAWCPDIESSGFNYAQSRNLICATIELSTETRTVFTVPWVCDLPYRRTPDRPMVVDDTGYGNDFCNGCMKIFVQNALTAPPTVANYVTINVWIRKGKGFEFGVPRMLNVVQNLNGVYQMFKAGTSKTNEVVENDGGVVAASDPAVFKRDPLAILRNTTVDIASTENIAGRTYNMNKTFTLSGSDVYGTKVLDLQYPQLLRDVDIAISGLMQYHTYYRITGKCTIRINAPPQYLGMYVLVFNPKGNDLGADLELPTHTQLPHAYIQPAFQSVASVDLPWTLNVPVLRRADTNVVGNIQIYAIVPLNPPPSAVTTLEGSVWLTLDQPYIGVKTVVGTFQSLQDGSSTDQQTELNPPNVDQVSDTPVGYFNGHTNVYDLVKRPTQFQQNRTINANTTGNIYSFVPTLTGRLGKIMSCWKYYSGSLRMTFASTASATHGFILEYSPKFTDQISTNVTTAEEFTYGGINLFKPGVEPSMIMEIPYYSRYPALPCPSKTQGGATVLQSVREIQWSLIEPNALFDAITVNTYMAAGDDFELYVPLTFPSTTQAITKEAVAQMRGPDDILKDGDVESNPGPPSQDFHKIDRAVKSDSAINFSDLFNLDRLTTKFSKKLVDGAEEKIDERLSNTMEDLVAKIVLGVEWATDVVVHFKNLFSASSLVMKTGSLVSLSLKFLRVKHLGERLLAKLQEVVGAKADKAQAGGEAVSEVDYTNLAVMISGVLFAGLISFLGYRVANQDSRRLKELTILKMGETFGTFGKFASGVKGITYLWATCKTALASAMTYFFEGKTLYESWYEEHKEECEQTVKDYESMKIDGLVNPSKMFIGVAGTRPYDRLMSLAEFAKQAIVYASEDKRCPAAHVRVFHDIIASAKSLTEGLNNAQGRLEPIGICIRGNAGCGKSFVTGSVLPNLVLKELGLAKDRNECRTKTYCMPRDAESKYMNGYQTQPWVIIDDFGQNTDDLDFPRIIQLISTVTCPIEMPSIEDKNTVFDSPFVVCSTNITTFKNSTVKDMSAVVRRFREHMYTMRLLTDSFKPSDLAEAYEREGKDVYKAMDGIWEFRRYDFGRGSNVGDVIKSKDFVEGICETYRKKFDALKQYDAVVDGIFQAGDEEGTSSVDTQSEETAAGYTIALNEDRISQEKLEAILRDIILDIRLTPEKKIELVEQGNFLIRLQRLRTDLTQEEVLVLVKEATQSEAAMLKLRTFYEKTTKLMRAFIEAGLALYGVDLQKAWTEQGNEGEYDNWTGLVTLFICGGSTYLVIKFIKWIWNAVFGACEVEAQKYENNTGRITRKQVTKKDAKGLFNMRNDIMTRINANLRRFSIVVGDEERVSLLGLALDAKHVVIPSHFVTTFRTEYSGHRVMMTQMNAYGEEVSWVPIDFSPHSVADLKTYVVGGLEMACDVALIKLNGANVDNARNIWKHIRTNAEWEPLLGCKYEVYLQNHYQLMGTGDIDFSCKVRVNAKNVPTHKRECFAGHGICTVGGDCGSLYYLTADVAKPLVGFHSYGLQDGKWLFGTGSNFGMTPLVLEPLEIARDALARLTWKTNPVVVRSEGYSVKEVECQLWTAPVMPMLGEATLNGVPLRKHASKSTNLQHSPLFGDDLPDEYAPSAKKTVVLESGEVVDPLMTNAQKYGTTVQYVPPAEVVSKAISHLVSKIPERRDRAVLDWDEAINGKGNVQSLVMKTSCGYWSDVVGPGKDYFFTALPQEYENGIALPVRYCFSEKAMTEKHDIIGGLSFFDYLIKCEDALKRGEPLMVLWVSTLKDELREKKKVAAGKTRVFEQPPLEFTLLVRKYMGSFLSWYRGNSGFDLYHGIGADKETVWSHYYSELNRWGGVCFDLDYSNYDGSVQPFAAEGFLEFVKAYYGHCGNHVVLSGIVALLQHKFHLVGDVICESFRGNPSGNPMTDVFNSVTNSILLLVMYQLAQRKIGLIPMVERFDQDVRMLTYGDDVIVAVSLYARTFFNRCVCKEIASYIGYTITAAKKDAEIVPFDGLLECTFLKSRFVPDEEEGVVFAPMPESVVYRELQWEHKANKGDLTVLQQRIDAALRMSVHVGRTFFNLMKERVIKKGYSSILDYDKLVQEIRLKQWEYDDSLCMDVTYVR